VTLSSGSLSLPSCGLAKPIGTARELRFDLLSDALFGVDKAETQARGGRRAAAATGRGRGPHERAPLPRVEGHTDGKGAETCDLNLSRWRAESVTLWLTRNGVAAASAGTEGFGRSRPLAPNTKPDGSDDPEGRQENRRVEIAARQRLLRWPAAPPPSSTVGRLGRMIAPRGG
jgi:outer membrane protein OmpA-like peptidoglycan-associated protein